MAVGNKVKGITIEFNGDTTKLGKALGEVEKKTKGVDQALRDVNKALKFNPGNTELLAQKQTLLKEKIGQTKDKLELLRQTQQKLDADDSVDKNSQEYMELRREIIETESKLKHFETELKKLDNIKFEKVGKQVQDVGDKMKTVGTNMTKYVTAPIVAGAGLAVKAFKEVDAGLDIITKKTGASGKELDAMKDSAKNLAQEIPTDFETAGSAIGEVNTRFGLTGQALEDLSGKFIKFAKLNDTDVSDSVDKVQKAMTAFGMPTEEAGNMLDILNKVAQDTGIDVDRLTESLVTNAPQLQAMGFDAQRSAVFVGQLEKSGIDSSKAMTGLYKAIVNGAKVGKTLPETMQEIQDSIVNASSETDAMNAAVEIFGSKAGPAIATAARNGSLDFQALAGAALDASGSVEKTFGDTLDPADRFTMAMNSMKVTGYEAGAVIMETAAPAIQQLSEFIKAAAEKWQQLDPETQKFIIKAAGIVAVVGPVLVALGSIITKVGMLITFLPALAGALPAVGAAFSALLGPVGLVIAAIAAAIAIGVALYKNWDTIKEKAGQLWSSVKSAFSKVKDAIVQPIKAAVDTVKKLIDKIKNFFKFKVSLPHIKLPHFAINPKGWQLVDLLQGSIPSLGIDWYAKGAIFKSPQIVGVGDTKGSGGEAALPLDPFWERMDKMADSIVNGVMAAMKLQAAGAGGGDITIPIYLYPSGPKMGEETVKTYDKYKKIMG